ncbi:MAG: alkaline phosphatase family protein [Caldilineaceae bacterium]|nr:alkaline phosphatase family protein [Caldilineaceae bacterium]
MTAESGRRRVICLFLDGVGLGADDPAINPLAVPAALPALRSLLDDRAPVLSTGRLSAERAELIPTDAGLGVPGRPQSATGQAALLTGINAPRRLGEHYGPRPDARVRAVLDEGSIFRTLRDAGRPAYFCNAYPAGYFAAVERGKRLLSAVPYAATAGGQALPDADDLRAGRALAADFTAQGWVDQLGYTDVPVLSPAAAGRDLWRIAQPYDFVFFEHWMTDVLGHRGQLEAAVQDLAVFDGFLAGLLAAADLSRTLIIVTSDHGNVEDCSHGKHTENPALTVLLGAERKQFARQIRDLTDFVPVILDYLTGCNL